VAIVPVIAQPVIAAQAVAVVAKSALVMDIAALTNGLLRIR